MGIWKLQLRFGNWKINLHFFCEIDVIFFSNFREISCSFSFINNEKSRAADALLYYRKCVVLHFKTDLWRDMDFYSF